MTSYDPLIPAINSNPFPHYAELRESAPVHWVGSMNGFAVSRYDDIVGVLADPQTFTSSKFWPALLGEYDPVPEVAPMISMDPPGHVRLRKLANKAFVPARIAALQDRTAAVAAGLIADITARHGMHGEFDFMWEFAALFPVSVIADVLGVDLARRAEFKHWVDDLLSASNRSVYGPERLTEIRRSSDALRAYFEETYDRRAVEPREDLISAFIQAEVNGERLTRAEVLNLAILLLIGGVETTTNLLGNTFTELRRRPDIYARVRRDPALVPKLVEEVLRFNSPVQIIFRHATRPTEIAGTPIPEGALIFPLLGSANRDPAKFDRPEEFDIDRTVAHPILSFGHGPHFCLGSYLSRMEARVALEHLFRCFDELMPVSEQVTWMDSYFARGPRTLPVSFRAAA